jgi:VWFA-related protein
VTGLPRHAFAVLENDEPQTVSFFTSADAPVTVGLIVDNSGSMYANRDRVIAAARAFAESSNPEDEIFVLAFNDEVRAALPVSAPFTSEIAPLREALTRTLRARGRTALYDAIAAGLAYVAKGRHERSALIVVSDGGDNASRATFAEVIAMAQVSNALIHTVALVDPADRGGNIDVLKRIAEASGGEAFAPRSARRIADVLRQIARDIRHTYTLGYVSTNTARDGTFRPVRVVVDPPDGRRVVVRARAGYRAGLARVQDEDDGPARRR